MVTGENKITPSNNLVSNFLIKNDDKLQQGVEYLSLYIEICTSKFSFAILNEQIGEFVLLTRQQVKSNLVLELRNFIQRNEDLLQNFKSVYSITCSATNDLIPEYYFDEELMDSYFQLSAGNSENISKDFQVHRNADVVSIFSYSTELKEAIEKHYPESYWLSSNSILLETGILESQSSEEVSIKIDLCDLRMNLAIFENGSILFSNVYECLNKEDVLYYLLYATEQFDINVKKAVVLLSGDTDIGGELEILLTKYIANVKFSNPLEYVNFGSLLEKVNPHNFTNLLNAYMCG